MLAARVGKQTNCVIWSRYLSQSFWLSRYILFFYSSSSIYFFSAINIYELFLLHLSSLPLILSVLLVPIIPCIIGLCLFKYSIVCVFNAQCHTVMSLLLFLSSAEHKIVREFDCLHIFSLLHYTHCSWVNLT